MTFNKEMEQDALLSEEADGSSFSDSNFDSQTEKHPFLELPRKAASSKLFPWLAILIHTGIFAAYTILFLLIVVPLWTSREREVAYIPFSPGPQAQVFQHKHSVYVGKPSSDLDEAWKKMLKNSNIRITEDEMSHIPGRKEQAIELQDGGYFATLNVYHNLHCIKRLHHYMYPDHYFLNITEEQKRANEYHNHHCLDMLRQSIMCQGDMQLLTMKWRQDGRIPTANFTSPHRCVNWDRLESWATSRRIANLMEPGYLNHPTLGPAYPDGHGDLIGEFLGHSNASTSE
ncbi:hypothetical protein FVEG_03588 [Fusarium verticillioides 7600]|uniref:Tat pathway signal sequence n=1 Tax=Gibberella moniliformis (strain M3125 / FGSC 7600) TaxID=334819 RepID=W7LSE4_GIBM7|nr:hypothetical protein FVEG_03588 [Fusarium verticillioides 7600]EWG41476.1 hypothetical protein FVEG_03588 [Fusarium verticillioides 7600]